ncbi:efflux RND transporter periplasmic adaptor subunit [Caproiciproducens sp.]
MKKVISVFLCAAMLVLSLTACGGSGDKLSVTTAKVKSTDVPASTDYTGTVHAAQSMAVITGVTAKVTSVAVVLGQRVGEGDVLMQLDTSDAALALKQAQAGLDTANANFEKIGSSAGKQAALQAQQALSAAQNELRDANANYSLVKQQFDQKIAVAPAQAAYDKAKADSDRAALMFSTGAASQYDVNSAKNALNAASAQLESAKASAQNAMNAADSRRKNAKNSLNTAQENYSLTVGSLNPENTKAAKAGVDSAEVAVEIAQKRISDSTVRAPISGTVGAVSIKAGDLAGPQAPAFQIVGDSGMEVTVGVTETMIRKLAVGSKATVVISATGEKLDGSVTETAAMAAAQTGMFTVKVGVNAADGLKDGMQADVSFLGDGDTGTVLVPARSVQERDGKQVVFAARNGKAVQVEVTVGKTQGAYVEVKGLGKDDEVLVQGANKAKDGVGLHIVSNTND